MISISKEEFLKLKEQKLTFNVTSEFTGDELTAINIYYNLDGKKKFLLESSIHHEDKGRYSFMGVNPYMEVKSYGNDVDIIENGEKRSVKGKVLDVTEELLKKNFYCTGLKLPFLGGAIGYVGYDVIKQYEKIPAENKDVINVPEAFLLFYKTYVAYDHFNHNVYLVYTYTDNDNASYEEVVEALNLLQNKVRTNNNHHKLGHVKAPKFTSNTTKEEFLEKIEKAKEHILKGDIFQVVLSQRLSCETNDEPFEIYRRLRSKNPSPYLFFLDYEEFQIIGSSPESLVTVKNGRVITNPIAGTRKRGANIEEDLILKEELINDEKERAEHMMLVDLGRNDIGRVSKIGTVELDQFMEVELYSKVMHIVSKVSGELKGGITAFEALSSCMPAGTVSGAPKVRAMEIIEELETEKRGIYAGAVGYFSYSGDMDTCIAIRTILHKDNRAYVQAGAGIVYDSDPESEYLETLNKALGLLEVI